MFSWGVASVFCIGIAPFGFLIGGVNLLLAVVCRVPMSGPLFNDPDQGDRALAFRLGARFLVWTIGLVIAGVLFWVAGV